MDGSAGAGGEQQFCLRWNNFQANITSQFEALRDDEELVDVTLAVEGQRLEAHKVVLSACSPYFKDLFKNNPCAHPIIFMRDCEAAHVRALLQFMYAGQVNIAQAQLSAFLRTADALQIRGLTDSAAHTDKKSSRKSPPSQLRHLLSSKPGGAAVPGVAAGTGAGRPAESSPERSDEPEPPTRSPDRYTETNNVGSIRVKRDLEDVCEGGAAGLEEGLLEPKLEVVERDGSDDDPPAFLHQYYHDNNTLANPFAALTAHGNMELLSGLGGGGEGGGSGGGDAGEDKWTRCGRAVPDAVWLEQHRRALPFAHKREVVAPPSAVASHHPPSRPKLIKLGEGVEVREELLRGVKWGDYRKVTRGLAAALFSPAELATCSVTGQRWSRAGQEARPTKPPLDRRRVHALISYVSRHFPDVEVSRIKQVLAYKCKENCAALRMRAATESGALRSHPTHHHATHHQPFDKMMSGDGTEGGEESGGRGAEGGPGGGEGGAP